MKIAVIVLVFVAVVQEAQILFLQQTHPDEVAELRAAVQDYLTRTLRIMNMHSQAIEDLSQASIKTSQAIGKLSQEVTK